MADLPRQTLQFQPAGFQKIGRHRGNNLVKGSFPFTWIGNADGLGQGAVGVHFTRHRPQRGAEGQSGFRAGIDQPGARLAGGR